MTATQAVPGGDPAGLRSVVSRLDDLASVHATQRSAFQERVKAALNGWTGPLAEQYAFAAGQCSVRFTAVCTQLKAAGAALSTYALALEGAQQTISSINGQLRDGHRDPSAVRRLEGQDADAITSLNQAARQCSIALYAAEAALGASCPETIAAQQLLALARRAQSGITSTGELQTLEFGLSVYAIVKDGVAAGKGVVAGGRDLREAKALVKTFDQQVMPLIRENIARARYPGPFTVAWKQVRAGLLDQRDGARAAALGKRAEGFLNGLADVGEIDVMLAPADVGFGVYSIFYPGDGPAWERIGNMLSGAVSSVGGARLMAWSADAFALDWFIPGPDVLTGGLLAGSAIWTLATLIYDERHNLAAWYDEVRHSLAHVGDEVGHELNPVNWAHELGSELDPMSW